MPIQQYDPDSPPHTEVLAALPSATAALLGKTIVLDSGSGESVAYICLRAGDEAYDWVQTAAGGA